MKKSNIAAPFLGVTAGAICGGMLVKKIWLEKYHKQKAELSAWCCRNI